jgi:hypothetical protein
MQRSPRHSGTATEILPWKCTHRLSARPSPTWRSAGRRCRSRKVRLFFAGIYFPSLFAAKGIVSATPYLNASFDNTVNFISEEYDKVKAMTTSKRNVSALHTNDTASSNKRFKSNPKGAGKDSTSNNNNKSYKKDKTYSPQEWWALSQDQRDKITKARALKRKNNNKRGDTKRNVSVVEVEQLPPPPQLPVQPPTPIASQRNVSMITRRVLPDVS